MNRFESIVRQTAPIKRSWIQGALIRVENFRPLVTFRELKVVHLGQKRPLIGMEKPALVVVFIIERRSLLPINGTTQDGVSLLRNFMGVPL